MSGGWIKGLLAAVFAAGAVGMGAAAEPWAMWTRFSGAEAEGGLAPQAASTQSSIDGSAWRLKLAGEAQAAEDGKALTTGATTAPSVAFGSSINVGRATNGGTPMTVLLAVQAPLPATVDKPLVDLNNGSGISIGMALAALDASAQTATLRGTWANAAWGTPRAQVNALAGSGVVYVAFSTCVDGSTPSAVGVVDMAAGTVAWTPLSGLTGGGINVTQLHLGNFFNASSGGLNYTLKGLAIYAGRPADDEMLNAVQELAAGEAIEKSGSDAWLFEDVADVWLQPVTVTAASSPASFTVNNNKTAYTISGEPIGGTTGLLKQGSGLLKLTGKNTFSGGVTIEGGTVVESGVTEKQAALGTGKNGSWANKLTLKNGIFDLNQTKNYANGADSSTPTGWLSVQTLTLGGQAGGVMTIRNGVFGIGTKDALVYDAANNPGTATIAAAYNFTGTSGTATYTFTIGDSSATETEVDFTGGLHVDNWKDGGATTIEKKGAGAMQLSSQFGFAGLKVTEGTVRLNRDNAFVRGTLTLNGGTLDLNGTSQALPAAFSGTSGTLTSSSAASLTVSAASTFSGTVSGAVSLTAQAPVTLTGEVSTTGKLTVVPGGSLTFAQMPASATVVVDVEAYAILSDGVYTVLTIPGETDESRIEWKGLENAAHVAKAQDAATGVWTLTVKRTTDNFIVMPMGDSITEGYNSSEDAPSYRRSLARMMAASGMTPRFVGARLFRSSYIEVEDCRYHSGFSGQRVQTGNNGRSGFLQGAPNWLEQAGYPDAVLLMIGTNDSVDTTDESVAAATAEDVFTHWKALVKTMADLRPNTWFIVSPITPARITRPKINAYIKAYNERIKSLFTATTTTLTVNGEEVPCVLGTLNESGKAAFGDNARVIMASMYDALPAADNKGYYIDDLHPNKAGYDRMAAVWFEAIKTIRGDAGGLKDEEAIAAAYQTAGAMDSLTVVFNRQQREAAAVTVTAGGETVEVTATALSDDGRRVTLTLGSPLADGAEVVVVKGAAKVAFTAQGRAVASRVPQALRKGYVQVKTYDVPLRAAYANAAAAQAAFTSTAVAEKVEAFDRVGYYVTLARPDGALRYLWVSMDRPSAYTTVEALGLPTTALRTKVSNLRVASNMPGIEPVEADGVEGLLQFGGGTLSTGAADSAHPVSQGAVFDWNSTLNTAFGGYGAMQVFRLYEEGVGRADSGMPASTLFSYSHWSVTTGSDNDEILLGDLANHQGYQSWYQTNSLTGIFTCGFPTLNTSAYSVRSIEIWVRPEHAGSPEIDLPEGAAEDYSEAVKTAVAAAVAKLPGGDVISRVSSVTVTNSAGKAITTDVAVANDVAAVFSGVVTASPVADDPLQAVVTVAYDFGIHELSVVEGVVYVGFRVIGTEADAADFAEGVRFALVTPEGVVLAAEDADDAALRLTDVTPADAEPGVRRFTFPLPASGTVFRARVSRD